MTQSLKLQNRQVKNRLDTGEKELMILKITQKIEQRDQELENMKKSRTTE